VAEFDAFGQESSVMGSSLLVSPDGTHRTAAGPVVLRGACLLEELTLRRKRSKPLFVGSIPTRDSNKTKHTLLNKRFSVIYLSLVIVKRKRHADFRLYADAVMW
jgi:hypothetical protein